MASSRCIRASGDAGELLDSAARTAYKAQLDELQAELDVAEGFNHPARAAQAREEMNFLVRELARAVGLGGRDRRAASHAERARLNVTRAIRAAMSNLALAGLVEPLVLLQDPQLVGGRVLPRGPGPRRHLRVRVGLHLVSVRPDLHGGHR